LGKEAGIINLHGTDQRAQRFLWRNGDSTQHSQYLAP